MEKKSKKINKFISQTIEFNAKLNYSIQNNRILLQEKEHKYIKSFLTRMFELKKIIKELDDELYEEFLDIQSSIEIESKIGKFITYIDGYPVHMDGFLSDAEVFKNLSSSLVYFIPFLKYIKKECKKIDKNSKFLDPINEVDKKVILEHVIKSLEHVEDDKSIPSREKEKIIHIHNTIIKEVEKPKTVWSKVLGLLNVLSISCTLYVSAPDISKDISLAYQGIIKEYNPSSSPLNVNKLSQSYIMRNEEDEKSDILDVDIVED